MREGERGEEAERGGEPWPGCVMGSALNKQYVWVGVDVGVYVNVFVCVCMCV